MEPIHQKYLHCETVKVMSIRTMYMVFFFFTFLVGTCNFENGQCGWNDVSSGRYNWHIFQGSSPGTGGPKTDHTNGTAAGHYMLVEGATGVFYSRARMETPPFGATGPSCRVTFYYHMFGLGAGKYLSLSLVPRLFLTCQLMTLVIITFIIYKV